jgi:hypothetical protein
LIAAIICGVLLLAYAYFVEPFRLVVNEQELAIEGWDKEFDGFRISLSPTFTEVRTAWMKLGSIKVVETANSQKCGYDRPARRLRFPADIKQADARASAVDADGQDRRRTRRTAAPRMVSLPFSVTMTAGIATQRLRANLKGWAFMFWTVRSRTLNEVVDCFVFLG